MLKAWLATAAMVVVATAAEPLTIPPLLSSSSSASYSSSSSSSLKRRREQKPSTTRTAARINNKNNKSDKKTKDTEDIKSILDICQVPYGQKSNGYSDAFRNKSKAERKAIMDKFHLETIGFTPMTEFIKGFYPCPTPFKESHLKYQWANFQ